MESTDMLVIIFLLIIILLGGFLIFKDKNVTYTFSTIDEPKEDLPSNVLSCSDYDIEQEFKDYFGVTNYLIIQNQCEATAPGGWTDTYEEVSCNVGDSFVFDCNTDVVIHSKQLCQALKADYTCRDDFTGCLCNVEAPIPPITDSDGDGFDDDEEEEFGTDPNDPSDYPGSEQEESHQFCAEIYLEGFGDFGPQCAEGLCGYDMNCDNYWDYSESKHHCGCSETFFCGQYCYEYVFTSDCECPPNSNQMWTTRSTFICVPEGYECIDGTPKEYDTVI